MRHCRLRVELAKRRHAVRRLNNNDRCTPESNGIEQDGTYYHEAMGVQFSQKRQICTAKAVESAAQAALKPADPLAIEDMVRSGYPRTFDTAIREFRQSGSSQNLDPRASPTRHPPVRYLLSPYQAGIFIVQAVGIVGASLLQLWKHYKYRKRDPTRGGNPAWCFGLAPPKPAVTAPPAAAGTPAQGKASGASAAGKPSGPSQRPAPAAAAGPAVRVSASPGPRFILKVDIPSPSDPAFAGGAADTKGSVRGSVRGSLRARMGDASPSARGLGSRRGSSLRGHPTTQSAHDSAMQRRAVSARNFVFPKRGSGPTGAGSALRGVGSPLAQKSGGRIARGFGKNLGWDPEFVTALETVAEVTKAQRAQVTLLERAAAAAREKRSREAAAPAPLELELPPQLLLPSGADFDYDLPSAATTAGAGVSPSTAGRGGGGGSRGVGGDFPPPQLPAFLKQARAAAGLPARESSTTGGGEPSPASSSSAAGAAGAGGAAGGADGASEVPLPLVAERKAALEARVGPQRGPSWTGGSGIGIGAGGSGGAGRPGGGSDAGNSSAAGGGRAGRGR